MKVSWSVEIAGTGMSVAEQVVTNHDFAQRLDTSHEWIVQRTGICERHIARPDQSTLHFATGAARNALENAKVDPSEIDLIIIATITPEHPLPSTACELQAALGCGQVPSLDIQAACSGFVYAFVTASQYLHTGMASTALVIGAETMTRVADMDDRASAILFGDGAAAAILRKGSRPEQGVLASRLGADGTGAPLLWIPAGGSAEPASAKTLNEKLHFMRMKGREVYKFAVHKMQEILQQTLDDAGVAQRDLKLVIPHQSNLRIIESAAQKIGLTDEQVFVNIDRYGNTSAASIPIALHEARSQGRIGPGDLVAVVAFGAGLTWGSALLRL